MLLKDSNLAWVVQTDLVADTVTHTLIYKNRGKDITELKTVVKATYFAIKKHIKQMISFGVSMWSI